NYLMYRGETLTRVQSLGVNGFETGKVSDTILDGIACGSTDIADYEPIPLTPEWLERLGFKKNETKDWWPCYVLDDYNIYFDNGDILMDGDYIPTARIEYVHQFQNLYSILTGEELEIKETV